MKKNLLAASIALAVGSTPLITFASEAELMQRLDNWQQNWNRLKQN